MCCVQIFWMRSRVSPAMPVVTVYRVTPSNYGSTNQ